MKKIMAVLLVFVMLLGIAPVTLAAEVVASGTSGEDTRWTLYSDGVLLFEGEGRLDYYEDGQYPWDPYAEQVKVVRFTEDARGTDIRGFAHLVNLERFEVDEDCPVLAADETGALVRVRGFKNTELLKVPLAATGTYTVSEGLTKIENNAFTNCSRLTDVVIPESVTAIDGGAFKNCTGLTKLTFPTSLRRLGEAAFYGCSNLTELYFTGSYFEYLPYDITDHSMTIYYPQGSGDWEYIKKTQNMPNITWVPWEPILATPYANGVCGDDARWEINNYRSIVISGAGEMKAYAPGEQPWRLYSDKLTGVSVNGVENLSDYAFYRFGLVDSAGFANSVKRIGVSALEGTNLWSVVLPKSIKEISSRAFADCSRLTEIRFYGPAPDSIAEDAFAGVTATVYYTLGDRSWNDVIGSNFGGNLTWEATDQIGHTLEDYDNAIEAGAVGGVEWYYLDDNSLILQGAGLIPDYSAPDGDAPAPWADHCGEVTVIYIDGGISSIGENAFTGFTALEEVYFLGDAPEIADNAFTGVTAQAAFFIYADGWSEDKLTGCGGELEWHIMYVPGDVNIDGEQTNADLVMLARFIVGLYSEDSAEYAVITAFGDMDGDEQVTNTDVVTLARIIVGLK